MMASWLLTGLSGLAWISILKAGAQAREKQTKMGMP